MEAALDVGHAKCELQQPQLLFQGALVVPRPHMKNHFNSGEGLCRAHGNPRWIAHPLIRPAGVNNHPDAAVLLANKKQSCLLICLQSEEEHVKVHQAADEPDVPAVVSAQRRIIVRLDRGLFGHRVVLIFRSEHTLISITQIRQTLRRHHGTDQRGSFDLVFTR